MGYILKGDFETSYGKLNEIYVRIESFHFSKPTGMCTFSYTYWPDKKSSDKHTPTQEGDKVSKTQKLLDTNIIVYKNESSYKDILLPHSLNTFAGTVKTIEEPVYVSETYTEEIPYVSFDENGDEITKYRTVIKEKMVQGGTTPTTKKIFDSSVLINIQEKGYNNLKEVLLEWIDPSNLIQS